MNKETKKRDVILINKMCTGSFTINNIGHEIINYFKDDNGDNYIYISPYGGMGKKYNDRIDMIILTSSLSNQKVEIQAIIELDDNSQIHKDGDKGNKEIHKKQVDYLVNVTYGGATFEQIFRNNKGNKEAIYVTFKAKRILKPDKGIKIYISNNENDKNNKNIIMVKKTLPSSSLKGYFVENEENDYQNIKKYIEDNKGLFIEYKTSSVKDKIKDFELDKQNINYLQIIEKVNEEQIYTNLIYYWLSRNNLFDKFVKEKLPEYKDSYVLQKEKRTEHGRMDIFAIGETNAIIIENKVKSGLNGIDKEKEITQLGKYVKDINKEYKKNKIFGLIFAPDYNISIIEKQIKELEKKEIIKSYRLISYSDLMKFFEENRNIVREDLYYSNYYEDFLRCLRNHTYQDIDEKNKEEMERKFIYAIKNALEKNN